jgi:hypothetical protein
MRDPRVRSVRAALAGKSEGLRSGAMPGLGLSGTSKLFRIRLTDIENGSGESAMRLGWLLYLRYWTLAPLQ